MNRSSTPKPAAAKPVHVPDPAVLQAANRPMDAAAVSRAFKGGGKRIEQRVVQALSTLVRYGWISALPGGTYAARRAA
ncbi:hypothetical protein [Brevundimonas aurantiaca]|uniref:hypothetical protein n=1 Tax=Brevundimonas aurantiaca TaxID=74316 RepID=UPI002FDECCB5